MIEPCPVCAGADVEPFGAYRGSHPTFQRLERVHCRSCDMVFATPMPDAKSLDEYNASYFDSAHGGQSRRAVATAFFSGIARLRMGHVERYLGKHNIDVNTLMELGPGPGYFAKNWLGRRPATVYLAVETDSSCHGSLRAAGVQLLDPSSLQEKSAVVDLVVMSHVLEHVPDPAEFLRNATRSLKKGGAIFIEVPCQDWEHKPVDEPHILFFDKKPMLHLLNKLGFDHIEVGYYGQEIHRLQAAPRLRAKWTAIRSRLIAAGLVAPFARIRPGMEALENPLERAAVAPFRAHSESPNPAWWLRAVARKTSE